MNRLLRAGVFLIVAAFAGLAGYHFNRAKSSPPKIESSAQKLLRATYVDPDGKFRNLSSKNGRVLVVNFWATWCAPCREEIPELNKLSKKYASKGVEFAGIAIDNASKVREYAVKMDISYELLIGSAETLAISKDLGNQAGVLPFTLVLDQSRTITYTHTGALTAATLEAVLVPLL